MSKRRRKKSTPGVQIPHKYIVHAHCIWWDRDFGATTYSNPTIHVTATDPAKAIDDAHNQIRAQAGRRKQLHGFRVDTIIDKGPVREEATICTIGLL